MIPLSAAIATDDDKYAKAAKATPRALSKYHEAFQVLSNPDKLLSAFGSAFLPYSCFLLACGVFYHSVGGDFRKMDVLAAIRYVSVIAEGLGLIVLRQKILGNQSAAGVSGMTMIMYLLSYGIRMGLMLPVASWDSLDDWMVEALNLVSLLMVCDVLRSVFLTFRSSYQEDLDVLKVKYLIPACVVLPALLHPDLGAGALFNYGWTVCLYFDVLALMPQVVLMSRGQGTVAAPISHFVAATALSRFMDLEFWFHAIQLVGFWTAALIIFFHLVHLLLIADFMYYYLKARLSGSSPSEDLVLPTCDIA